MHSIVWLLLVTLIGLTANSHAETSCPDETRLHHVVVVWMKEDRRSDADVAALIAAHKQLNVIPQVLALDVGPMIPSERAVVDSTYDVASHFVFCDETAMQRYVEHPVHQTFLKDAALPMIDHYRVYDFRTQ